MCVSARHPLKGAEGVRSLAGLGQRLLRCMRVELLEDRVTLVEDECPCPVANPDLYE